MATELTIVRHCLCGSSMTVATKPPALALMLDGLFNERHFPGNGHGPATAKQAAGARRRADKAATDGD